MTRETIYNKFVTILVNIEDTEELSQEELNQITDEVSAYCDTINPDREYPKVVIR